MLEMLSSIGVAIVCLICVGFILTKFYQKAPKGLALVVTGRGKQRVVIDGGCIYIALYQTMTKVNLKSIKIAIEKKGKNALNTKDRILVDVVVDFFIRCKIDEKSVAKAAEKLGEKTLNPSLLREHLESKFEGAIRAVAQAMEHDELFENRQKFNKEVLEATIEGLEQVGYELEDVQLIDVKQTPLSAYEDDNMFNSFGKAIVVKRIAEKQKETNDIEKQTAVEIQKKNLEAKKESLELAREQEYAALKQEKELATRKASQESEIAQDQANRAKEADTATIAAAEATKQASIELQKKTAEEMIAKNRVIESAQIEKDKTIEIANINRQRELEVAEEEKAVALAEASKKREEAELNKQKLVALAQQQKEIEVAEKSKQKSIAQGEADAARAKAIEEQEKVITVQKVAIAEREKRIKLTKAAELAEEQAIGKRVSAEADKLAAEDYAEATRITSEAEANKTKVKAEATKQAGLAEVEVQLKKYEAEAEGKRKLHDAENALSDQQIKLKKELKFIETLPLVMYELNKPIEKIDSIKIFQTDGVMGGGQRPSVPTVVTKDGQTVAPQPQQGNGMMDQLVNTMIGYQFQKPIVDEFLKDFGVAGSDPMTMVRSFMPGKEETKKTKKVSKIPATH